MAGEAHDAPVRVVCRVRPPSSGGTSALECSQNSVALFDTADSTERVFPLDSVLDTRASQEDVYEVVGAPVLKQVLDGFNACILFYGQTGSGKTHSCFGDRSDRRGLVPRMLDRLWEAVESRAASYDVGVFVQFMELYNDDIRDLLVGLDDRQLPSQRYLRHRQAVERRLEEPPANAWGVSSEELQKHVIIRDPALAEPIRLPELYSLPARPPFRAEEARSHNIREADGHVFVTGLRTLAARCPADLSTIIGNGLRYRETHPTIANAISSRSHAILTVHLIQSPRGGGATTVSALTWADLAGSERLNPADERYGASQSGKQRLLESRSINAALSALGACVNALRIGAAHIPFRDTKLTRLLSNVLSKNAFTTLLATLDPTMDRVSECLGTLLFARSCREVHNAPRINYKDLSGVDFEQKVAELQAEIVELKRRLADAGHGDAPKEDYLSASLTSTHSFQESDPRFLQDDYRFSHGRTSSPRGAVDPHASEMFQEDQLDTDREHYVQTILAEQRRAQRQSAEELRRLRIDLRKAQSQLQRAERLETRAREATSRSFSQRLDELTTRSKTLMDSRRFERPKTARPVSRATGLRHIPMERSSARSSTRTLSRRTTEWSIDPEIDENQKLIEKYRRWLSVRDMQIEKLKSDLATLQSSSQNRIRRYAEAAHYVTSYFGNFISALQGTDEVFMKQVVSRLPPFTLESKDWPDNPPDGFRQLRRALNM